MPFVNSMIRTSTTNARLAHSCSTDVARCYLAQQIGWVDILIHSPFPLAFHPSQYHKSFAFYCDLCQKHINSTDKAPRWLYYCNLCRYFAHISCMAQFQDMDRNRVHKDDSSLRLPAGFNSPELIQSFVATVNENNSSFSAVQSKIQMFSHKHPLTLSHKQILENDTEDDEEILCDACIDPIIYPPYYHCAKCRYFLHLHCAKLPRRIESVKYFNYIFKSSYFRNLHWENMPRILEKGSHPHPLILGSTTRFYDNFRCNLCNKFSNGFYYSCEVEECRFHPDLKCAVLPSIMKHESHKHLHDVLLLLKGKNYTKPCGACNINLDKGSTNFECESCEFYLHERWALLPKTVRHDFDIKHPLTLRFPPHYYHEDPFDTSPLLVISLRGM